MIADVFIHDSYLIVDATLIAVAVVAVAAVAAILSAVWLLRRRV